MVDMQGNEVPAGAKLVQSFSTERDMYAWFKACGRKWTRPGTWVVWDSKAVRPYEVWEG